MTYPKTNKNGFSGEQSSGVAYFFALAVFGLMVGGLSIGPDMERCKHNDTFKCYEYLISAVPGFLIAINVVYYPSFSSSCLCTHFGKGRP
jgi:hypothetical protein